MNLPPWAIFADDATFAALAEAAAGRSLPMPRRGRPGMPLDEARVVVVAPPSPSPAVLSGSDAIVVGTDDSATATLAGEGVLPHARLLSVGTVPETRALRAALAARLRVAERDVHAAVVGRSESPLPLWSSASVAGVPLHQWAVQGHGRLTVRDRAEIFMSLADAAQSQTAEATVDVVEAILCGNNRVLCVGQLVSGYRGLPETWLALPCIVNDSGAEPPLEVPLNAAELAGLQRLAALR